MYTNKFKRSTDTAVVTIVAGLVAGIHFAGYEALTASDNDTIQSSPAAIVQTIATETKSIVRMDVIVVTAKRL